MKHAAIILAAIGLSASTAYCADQITGVASVIDGDTIEIGEQRIRLFGLDAPEPPLMVHVSIGGKVAKRVTGRARYEPKVTDAAHASNVRYMAGIRFADYSNSMHVY